MPFIGTDERHHEKSPINCGSGFCSTGPLHIPLGHAIDKEEKLYCVGVQPMIVKSIGAFNYCVAVSEANEED